jgi:hypothetical protein
MGERYYDPALAHFTQRDPLNQINDLTQANRYAYVSGDPVNLTDPTGAGILSDAGKVVSKVSGAAGAAYCGVKAAVNASNQNAPYKGTLKSIPKGAEYFSKDYYNCVKPPFAPSVR